MSAPRSGWLSTTVVILATGRPRLVMTISSPDSPTSSTSCSSVAFACVMVTVRVAIPASMG